jgi:hypothetical protein
MRVQEPSQQVGKPRVTLDEVASAADHTPDAGHPLGHVIGGRLEDDAVSA